MVASKLLMGSIAVALVIYGVGADSGIEELRSRISALDSIISDRLQDIKKKNQSILNLENVIKEKSASIFSFLSEIELLQKQAAANAEQAVEKARKQAYEMKKQVARLKSEIEAQTMKRGALEDLGVEAEKKTQELNLKIESLQKTYNEQMLRIRSTERALQVAEEELMKAQIEAASKTKKLTEVHEAWILPWLALHMSHCQEVAATHWNKHGKPALDVFFQKASEKSALVKKWAELHLHTTRTKLIPAANEQMVSFMSNVQPYVQLMSAKTMEVYEKYKKTITPHIMTAQELADPYLQEARKFSMPCINQIANVAKPHVEKLQVLLDPYHKLAVHSYKKLAKTSMSCHNQASEKSALVKKWAELHLHTTRTKLIPAANEQMVSFMSNVQPYAQLMSAKTMEVYETYKKTITPHIMTAQELADPYLQEARKFSKPYINQIANVAKPHVEKLQVLLDPYHKLAVHSYKQLAKTTMSYHNQVKINVHGNLKKHELTKPLATWELSWFLASGILAFPMFFLFRLLLAIFCMKTNGGQKN